MIGKIRLRKLSNYEGGGFRKAFWGGEGVCDGGLSKRVLKGGFFLLSWIINGSGGVNGEKRIEFKGGPSFLMVVKSFSFQKRKSGAPWTGKRMTSLLERGSKPEPGRMPG